MAENIRVSEPDSADTKLHLATPEMATHVHLWSVRSPVWVELEIVDHATSHRRVNLGDKTHPFLGCTSIFLPDGSEYIERQERRQKFGTKPLSICAEGHRSLCSKMSDLGFRPCSAHTDGRIVCGRFPGIFSPFAYIYNIFWAQPVRPWNRKDQGINEDRWE